jgi:hypothetical protein
MSDKSNFPNDNNQNNLQNISSAKNLLNIRKTALKPIQYSARVTRNNPSAIVILIDQSGSMEEEFREGVSKAQVVADIVNELFDSLVMKCQREGGIRDYFQIMVIGYGKDVGVSEVSIIWEGNLAHRDWVSVSDLKENILETKTIHTTKMMPWGEVPDVKTKKIWLNPCHDGLTPMYEALQLCKEKLEDWIHDFQDSFPPMVFNITDGYPTDIDDLSLIEDICSEIKSIKSNDGETLLFNCLITNGSEIVFPNQSDANEFEDEYHLTLYNASSKLPHEMKHTTSQVFPNKEIIIGETKCVIINSTINSLINLLNVGTNTALENATE